MLILHVYLLEPVHTMPQKKRSFISTVRPSILTNPSENAALFLRFGLPPTLIRRKTAELFESALQTGGIWKRRFCISVSTEHILKRELLEIDHVLITMCFPCPSFPLLKKKLVIVAILNFSGVVWTKNILYVFIVRKNAVFKFLPSTKGKNKLIELILPALNL